MSTEQKRRTDTERPVERLVMWMRWPECLGYVPWYVIAWRIPWGAVYYAGLSIAWVGLAMANGITHANGFWRASA